MWGQGRGEAGMSLWDQGRPETGEASSGRGKHVCAVLGGGHQSRWHMAEEERWGRSLGAQHCWDWLGKERVRRCTR